MINNNNDNDIDIIIQTAWWDLKGARQKTWQDFIFSLLFPMVHQYVSLNFVNLDFLAWDQKYPILGKLTLVVSWQSLKLQLTVTICS